MAHLLCGFALSEHFLQMASYNLSFLCPVSLTQHRHLISFLAQCVSLCGQTTFCSCDHHAAHGHLCLPFGMNLGFYSLGHTPRREIPGPIASLPNILPTCCPQWPHRTILCPHQEHRRAGDFSTSTPSTALATFLSFCVLRCWPSQYDWPSDIFKALERFCRQSRLSSGLPGGSPPVAYNSPRSSEALCKATDCCPR
jgi:hypothetical protein